MLSDECRAEQDRRSHRPPGCAPAHIAQAVDGSPRCLGRVLGVAPALMVLPQKQLPQGQVQGAAPALGQSSTSIQSGGETVESSPVEKGVWTMVAEKTGDEPAM